MAGGNHMSSEILFMILFALTVIAATALQLGFGFGFAVIIMAVLPMFLPYNEAIVINLILSFVSNIVIGAPYFRRIQWKIVLPILIPTVIICSITALFAVQADSRIMYILLGFFFIALSLYFFLFSGKIQIRQTAASTLILGILCGVLNGLFSLAGPVVALYFLSYKPEKESYIGNLQLFFLVCNLFNTTIRLLTGSVSLAGSMPMIGIGIGALIIGALIGFKVFKNLKGKWLERGVYALVGLNGLWIVISRLFLMK